MALCSKCDATVFEGHPCIKCGHTEAVAPLQETGDGTGKKEVNVAVIVAAIVGTFAILGAGVLTLVGGGDDPEVDRLANVDDLTVLTLDDAYCDNPAPVADAQLPSATEANTFTAYIKADGTGYRIGSDIVHADFTDALGEGGAADLAYMLCVDGAQGDDDRTCTGYQGGATHTMFSKKYSYRLYELASGMTVSEGPVDSISMNCPAVVLAGQPTIQEVDSDELGMRIVDHILPAGGTDLHLGTELNFDDPAWCSTPEPLTLGDGEIGAPGVRYVGDWRDDLAVGSVSDPAQVTHVACLNLTLSGETASCEYEGGFTVEWTPGTYEVSVVDARTLEVVATQTFEGGGRCFSHAPSVRGNDVRGPLLPQESYDFVAAALGLPLDEN